MEKKFIKNILNKKIAIDRGLTKIKKGATLKICKKYIDFSESYNDKVCQIPFNDKTITYSYQRHDLFINCNNWLKFLYNIHNKKNNLGLFFNSCMAAISTLQLTLQKIGYKKFLFSNLPYFESYDFAESIFGTENVVEYKNYNGKDVDVLWICSASPNFMSVNYKKVKAKAMVMDTSCIDCSSQYIVDIVNYCNEKNMPLFLVRSHMKLDCFGLEINRLGSLVCANDNDNVYEKCKLMEIYLGNNTTIKNIYPWLGEEEFFKLTTKDIDKTKKIVDSASSMCNKLLDKNRYQVNKFDNNIYFVIKLKHNVPNLDKLNRDITIHCQKLGLPILTVASFYLEKVGLDNFARRLDDNSQFLRISPSFHISKKTTTEIVRTIAEYLNNM
ncbi:MAG: hypothetical protein IJ853_01170 [Rickettsiales bacterium]|nr:hypothetical protein [Rickettsiales bacterium]